MSRDTQGGSRLLLDERPVIVLPGLAVRLGLNNAIFLQQLHYWMGTDSGKVDTQGRRWIKSTYENWHRQLPFLAERTIRGIIASLRDNDYIITSGNLNDSKLETTLWYTINYAQLNQDMTKTSETQQIPSDEIVTASGKIRTESATPVVSTKDIYNIYTESTESTHARAPGEPDSEKQKEPKHKFGENKKVQLTDKQLQTLMEKHPDEYQKAIEYLDVYKESTGKVYKNDYQTILNWVFNAVKEKELKAAQQAQMEARLKGQAGNNGSGNYQDSRGAEYAKYKPNDAPHEGAKETLKSWEDKK